ncbi:hypothetical protein D047_0843A, partial [Vibrio parahaemolyticus VPTS-2010_2]
MEPVNFHKRSAPPPSELGNISTTYH